MRRLAITVVAFAIGVGVGVGGWIGLPGAAGAESVTYVLQTPGVV